MGFDRFRTRFKPRPMLIAANSSLELRVLDTKDGRRNYAPAPAAEDVTLTESLPRSEPSAATSRYLWVIDDDDTPHALETCLWAAALGLAEGKIKHSNLTGGDPAYFGGELWFVNSSTIVINFCSGRYGLGLGRDLDASDQERVEATIDALLEDGYTVATTGADPEDGWPSARLLIGEPEYRRREDG